VRHRVADWHADDHHVSCIRKAHRAAYQRLDREDWDASPVTNPSTVHIVASLRVDRLRGGRSVAPKWVKQSDLDAG
jgi:hypothetical protein